ncbi:MAG: zinc ABC transporter substrate-binding protein [archaeon GB-1867-005]|nr:zinc ABC transporter substrate-binding protein [Candidatus Culexmicrobium cathedralense]
MRLQASILLTSLILIATLQSTIIYVQCINNKLIIVTSIETLSLIAKEIGGDKLEVHTLLPEEAEPHAIQFTPKMLELIRNASLLILTGHFEFENELISTVNIPYVSLNDYVAHGLKLLEIPDNGINVHGYWLHPTNAIAIAEAIVEKLRKIDPVNGDYYTMKLNEFKLRVNKFLSNVNSSLIENYGLNWIEVVVAFPAAQYVLEALQMKIGAFLSKGHEAFVGGSELARIEEKLKRREYKLIVCPDIIMKTQLSDYVKQISKDTGAPIALIKTIGGKEFTSYVELISYNFGVIIGALSASSFAEPSEARGFTHLDVMLIIVSLVLAIIATIEAWVIIGRI